MMSGLELIFSTSRDCAETFAWVEPFAVISITDPGSSPVSLRQRNIVARCDLQFWDLLDDIADDRPIFTARLARTVLRFVNESCAQASLLLIHCEAGISRSTAMANAIGNLLGVEVRHQNALFISPNGLVTRLLEEQGGRGELLGLESPKPRD
jgi:predicted protein tyrosine phosphatase